jgi:serine/threonine protein kinase
MASGSTSSNVVGVHYRVGKKIGEGSFGVIFEGTNLLNQQQVAIKFEPRKSDAPQLRDEYRTYKILVGCRKYNALCPLSRLIRCTLINTNLSLYTHLRIDYMTNAVQLGSLMSIISARKAYTTFWSSTSSARAWRTCSITATGSSPSRRLSW